MKDMKELTEMSWLEWMEMLSYLVTIVGLPFAIAVLLYEKRKERQNDEEQVYLKLSDEYSSFLRLVLDHADLQLLRRHGPEGQMTNEQEEKKLAIFGILVSLFERAYMLVYEERMSQQDRRLWLSWEDYMREWCRRADFRAALPELLEGEDEQFCHHIERIADQAAGSDQRQLEAAAPCFPSIRLRENKMEGSAT